MGFLLGRKDVVHLIVQLFQGIVGEHQLLPPGLRLFQLLLELLPHGRQLRLFLIQLLFTLDQGVDPGAELGLCAVYFFLGVFQFFLFLVQLGGGIVQFTVDCSGDPVVQLVDQLLIQHHVQLLLNFAAGGDPGDAGNALQFVHQRFIQEFRQLHGVHALHGYRRHLHGKHGGVDLQHVGRAHRVRPVGGQLGDLLLDIHAHGVHVDALGEFQNDHANVFAGNGGHLLNVIQRGHGLLHGSGDLLLHLFRACTGVGGHDQHVREIHIGKQVGGHAEIGHHAQHQYGDHRDENRQRLFDGEFGHTALLTALKRGINICNSIAPFDPEYQLKMCKSFMNTVFCGGICSLFTVFRGCGTIRKIPMEGTGMKKFLAVLTLACLLTGCAAGAAGGNVYETTFLTLFDTVTTIRGRAESQAAFTEAAQGVHDTLLHYHQLFDIYNDYAGCNNLKTVNDQAGVAPVEVDGDIIRLLLECREFYDATGGKVNVAMGSVLALWHDARTAGLDDPANARLPDRAALENAAAHMDFDAVIIDEDASTVFISDPETRLDVGAVAKGWSAQRAAENAPEGLLISVGGNVCATGPKTEAGDPWVIGIQDPDGGDYLHTVCVTGGSVVTSGDYQRTYLVDGESYHHIIDPETLMPSRYWRSVTVVCADSGIADALSTALFLMPQDEGQTLLTRYNAEAMWVDADGGEFFSPGFRALLRT